MRHLVSPGVKAIAGKPRLRQKAFMLIKSKRNKAIAAIVVDTGFKAEKVQIIQRRIFPVVHKKENKTKMFLYSLMPSQIMPLRKKAALKGKAV